VFSHVRSNRSAQGASSLGENDADRPSVGVFESESIVVDDAAIAFARYIAARNWRETNHSTLERIDQGNTGPGNVLHISGRQSQPVDLGGCGKKAIDHRKGIRYVQPTPFFGDGQVHR